MKRMDDVIQKNEEQKSNKQMNKDQENKHQMKMGNRENCKTYENEKGNAGKMFSTKQMTRIAMMIAFISALSYVRIPLPFSEAAVTGQTLALNVIALLLTPTEAVVTMACYWLLGLVGAPVFGGMAGPGKLFGPGGGYFIAFMLAAALIAKLRGGKYRFGRYLLVTVLIGVFVIDGIGFVWLKLVTGMNWQTAFVAGVVAFAPLDILKCVVACIVVKPLRKALYMLDDM